MANIVRMRDVTKMVSLSKSTIYVLIKNGEFPKPFVIVNGGRARGWLDSTINKWAAERSMK